MNYHEMNTHYHPENIKHDTELILTYSGRARYKKFSRLWDVAMVTNARSLPVGQRYILGWLRELEEECGKEKGIFA